MADDRFGAGSAVEDFYRARRRAGLRHALALLSGHSDALLSYEEVRRRLHAVEASQHSLEDVPLDRIVGSVGRYNDFTREFLPRRDADEQRWTGVKRAMTGMSGTPPVELYRIGDAYFVKDGNHRVSVARQLGARYIQAYVTPVHARVPFSAHDDPEALILKSEYAAFLERTELDRIRPDADLTVTAPGAYHSLLEHISVHRYFMGLDQDRPIPYEEAVAHWYDTVYRPVVDAIRDRGLLHGFEGRTETDLYLWLSEHRGRLHEELGWELPSEQVAQGMAGGPLVPSDRQGAVLERLAATPLEERSRLRIADGLLVVLPGSGEDATLDQALMLARREGARIYGVRVSDAVPGDEERERLRERFLARCREAGVPGQLAFASGDPLARVLERAGWVDVLVANLVHDRPAGGKARLDRRLRPLLRRSPRPLLAVTGAATEMHRPLLAYDGGTQAEAALFATAYGAVKWGQHPVVISIEELGRGAADTLARAREYLERFGVQADYVLAHGAVAPTLVRVATERGCDLIVMGSYKYHRWLEDVFGGVPEQVLQLASVPVLIT